MDTLYLIPFLLVTYLLMEFIEHNLSVKTQKKIRRAGSTGPAIGALLGVIPQCGFSAASAALYAGRVVSLGTLFAVFISTSDEMIPLFIAESVSPSIIFCIVAAKVCLGMVFGFIIDAILRIIHKDKEKLKIHEICAREHCDCSKDCEACEKSPSSVYNAHDLNGHHDSHGLVHDHTKSSMFLSALIHTVKTTIFIFIITFIINVVFSGWNEDGSLIQFSQSNKYAAVLVSAIIGLIPNCASSVVIASLFCKGLFGIGSCLAGLMMSAGVGILILLKTNRPFRQSIFIVFILFCFSVFCGVITATFIS